MNKHKLMSGDGIIAIVVCERPGNTKMGIRRKKRKPGTSPTFGFPVDDFNVHQILAEMRNPDFYGKGNDW